MFLSIIQIVVGIALIIVVLLQAQGGGLSTSFGGSGQFYRSKRTLDKLLFVLTIIFAFLFAVLSLGLLLPR